MDQEGSELLSDTFAVLSCKEIKLSSMRSKPEEDMQPDEDEVAMANAVMQVAQKKLISQVRGIWSAVGTELSLVKTKYEGRISEGCLCWSWRDQKCVSPGARGAVLSWICSPPLSSVKHLSGTVIFLHLWAICLHCEN